MYRICTIFSAKHVSISHGSFHLRLNRFRNLFDLLKISNLYDFVTSHDIVVANSDLDYFLSSFILNYKVSKRLKEQYSVYRFCTSKFDAGAGIEDGFVGSEG